MSFVLYDVETTGLAKRFDQIVHFAAVYTDSELRINDRLQIRCRLMPHIVPSPEAMHLTGLRIGRLTDPALPSHFEMVTEIRQALQSWCPALFLGFNSLSFDEEFLRQAFYLCLHDAYLTNTQRSARADVLNLCRMTAALRPDVMKPALDATGRAVFKLKQLAEANGVAMTQAHDAMADVLTMHALCEIVRTRAPEIWSQFMRFSQKASVDSFMTGEEAFLVSETVGNQHRTRLVTRIGQHSEQVIRHYCLDLSADFDHLRGLSHDELIALCKTADRPIVTVRTNVAPTLWALYDATPEHLAPFDEAEILERVAHLRDDRPFLERLRAAAQAAERAYLPSPHVEEQLYERGFPPPQDKALMARFHAAPWEQRQGIARQFADERYRRLAMRLVYFERPDLLSTELRLTLQQQVRKRVLEADVNTPWRSVVKARRESEALIAGGLDSEDLDRQHQFLTYLDECTERLALPLAS
ncbi:exodeoxyribonuclease I [Mesorhizobium tianshanense]|uniref:Exodeoxyribonuclease I subunit C n=1 Tax=Mesorhizobium tianshanense TaxID=39844 RepID=A0A562NG54_9HYPH|nr:exonuclease domain-containing protein [Mesorhizobium tianshanense]TWI31107.1 exodeoxyribonuclease I subunit C [Mesorhizobium tianshanense]GLS37299.1 exodeoxyribonuclease I [Mesorhizobium tianshanense]